jgi:hypothetical protein
MSNPDYTVQVAAKRKAEAAEREAEAVREAERKWYHQADLK